MKTKCEFEMKNKIERLENKINRNQILDGCFYLVIFGAFLNIFVIIFNKSKMPVLVNAHTQLILNNETYSAFTNFKQVNYGILTDIFNFKIPYLIQIQYSIGDFFIILGVVGCITIFTKGLLQKIKRRRLNKNGID